MKSSARDTPMMRHFLAIKAQHPDAIVLYRMGDFYELFLEDAERAAPLLDITLTTRDKDKSDPVPMCGFPVHSADPYVKRLAELGHRVAICEQVEDPRAAGGKRLVRREVVEVVTPGLVGDPEGLDAAREVALAAVWPGDAGLGLAALDATTGDFRATALGIDGGARASCEAAILEELERIAPREVLLPEVHGSSLATAIAARLPETALTELAPARFDPEDAPVRPEGFEALARAKDGELAGRAAAALLGYLLENQPFALRSVPRLRPYRLGDTMILDAATRSHLEVFESSVDQSRRGTLIELVDLSTTGLGARRISRWLAYPLLSPAGIAERQDAVAHLAERDRLRGRLRDALAGVRDLERLLAKATRPAAVPRDLGVLRTSLQALPAVAALLAAADGQAAGEGDGVIPGAGLPPPNALEPPVPLPELVSLLEESLVDDPPVVARGSRGAGETGYIREGFRSELDALRQGAEKGREWIAGLEATERERTGIPGLKIRYHPVHGYSLEVSKTQLDGVPGRYERKQTLANVERFTTDELQEMQGRVMGSQERAAELEREIFESLRQAVVAESAAIRAAADRVADVDAIGAFAEAARRNGWVRPTVDDGERIEIRGGRHAVVEELLRRESRDGFVPNDTDLDPEDAQLWLLTGPNMSGKSTYLRQVALIVLLAQTGSFVPADSARIGVVDRIFTRVGASDRLSRGESTFMVEMRETAEILQLASRRSLVILDEIGRGTSTFDGLSIAWAVAEYLHDAPGLAPRTLFATHYHELTDLARTKRRVRNGHFEAREWEDEVVFLRRLVPGGASRSYGIQVARLAGLPESVTQRARQILANLEAGELDGEGMPRIARALPGAPPLADPQLSLGLEPASGARRQPGLLPTERVVLEKLAALDPERTTPIDALVALRDLRARLLSPGDGGGDEGVGS